MSLLVGRLFTRGVPGSARATQPPGFIEPADGNHERALGTREIDQEGPTVYRAPMRARTLDTGAFEGARLGTERGIVGIGEPLRETPPDLGRAILATADEHGDKAARMLNRFAELPEGTLVWTRTADEVFRLGVFAGPWWYDDSEAADRTGIHQVRAAVWVPSALDPKTVPHAVLSTFDRGGKNLQRIRDEGAAIDSRRLWRKAETRG